ncbi:hypothetical protein RRG08_049400 [Elysia crispata]|uniref:Uncharacterized protein n=1 Tax=Elysia crispata TaxID=231223 RepID=A0AAE0XEN0_9GAST|nr:hypothetical protein RRG08_049400 [Elysia crispata]
MLWLKQFLNPNISRKDYLKIGEKFVGGSRRPVGVRDLLRHEFEALGPQWEGDLFTILARITELASKQTIILETGCWRTALAKTNHHTGDGLLENGLGQNKPSYWRRAAGERPWPKQTIILETGCWRTALAKTNHHTGDGLLENGLGQNKPSYWRRAAGERPWPKQTIILETGCWRTALAKTNHHTGDGLLENGLGQNKPSYWRWAAGERPWPKQTIILETGCWRTALAKTNHHTGDGLLENGLGQNKPSYWRRAAGERPWPKQISQNEARRAESTPSTLTDDTLITNLNGWLWRNCGGNVKTTLLSTQLIPALSSASVDEFQITRRPPQAPQRPAHL